MPCTSGCGGSSCRWNDEQLDFIRQPLEDGSLLGIPGGGKTSAILGRLVDLVHLGLVPAKHGFVVATFSRSACQDFRRKGDAMHAGLFTNQNVRTLHSLAGAVYHAAARDRGLRNNSSLETVVSRATRLVEESASSAELRGSVQCLSRLRTIVVDEAQDISAVQYKFVMALRAKLGVSVVMVGDPNQSIYGFQGGSDAFLRDHPGWKVTLRKNYRSTDHIVRLVQASRPCLTDVPMESARDKTECDEAGKPELFSGDLEQVRDRLVAQVRHEMASNGLKSCAIVGPVKRCYARSGASVDKLGLQWAANLLHVTGVPFAMHYCEAAGEISDDRNKAAAITPGRVHLMTVHGCKGLEFDCVIVLNYHRKTMGGSDHFKPTSKEHRDHSFLWYVALSRARTRMLVLRWAERKVWPCLSDRLDDFFDVRGVRPKKCSSETADRSKKTCFRWTELLRDRTRVDEETLVVLEDAMLDKIVPTSPFARRPQQWSEPGTASLPEWDALSSLYGMWAENHMCYWYRGEEPPCLGSIAFMVENTVCVPRGNEMVEKGVRVLRERLGLSSVDPIEWSRARVLSTTVASRDELFWDRKCIACVMRFLEEARRGRESFHVHVDNDCRWFDLDELRRMVDDWRRRASCLEVRDMWRMNFFLWQYEHEARYRWEMGVPSVTDVSIALQAHAGLIREWAASLEDGWEFQVPGSWPGLPISGVADACHAGSDQLVEMKFSPAGLARGHALQALGYARMVPAARPGLAWSCRVWNLYTGERVEARGRVGVGWSRAADGALRAACC